MKALKLVASDTLAPEDLPSKEEGPVQVPSKKRPGSEKRRPVEDCVGILGEPKKEIATKRKKIDNIDSALPHIPQTQSDQKAQIVEIA